MTSTSVVLFFVFGLFLSYYALCSCQEMHLDESGNRALTVLDVAPYARLKRFPDAAQADQTTLSANGAASVLALRVLHFIFELCLMLVSLT